MFYAATARRPEPHELESLGKACKRFETSPNEAAELIAMGETSPTENVPAAEQAAWTTQCLMVLNLDETLCK